MGETTTSARAPGSSRSSDWVWICAIWCAGGLFDSSQTVLVMRDEGGNHPWLPLFATEFATWLPWVLATPLISSLARRFPVARTAGVLTGTVHGATFSLLSLIGSAWSALLMMLINPWDHPKRPSSFIDHWGNSLLYQVLTYLIVYALILAITMILDSRSRIARQQTETARLNEELSRAHLAALRRQMEPHFMFNTLNSIAGLVRDHRNDSAVSMIVGLSEFLRRASEDSQRSQVTLAEEAEYLQRYVDIQKARFAERLEVSVEIPEELLQASVPNLLLQPLVENAIKHGIARRVAGGAVRVTAARSNGQLSVSVYNDGPLLPPDWQTASKGIGIANLRTRLQILHKEDFQLQLRNIDTTGVEVLVTLPLRVM
jgi:two-component system, LytTR family, sensor kinase